MIFTGNRAKFEPLYIENILQIYIREREREC